MVEVAKKARVARLHSLQATSLPRRCTDTVLRNVECQGHGGGGEGVGGGRTLSVLQDEVEEDKQINRKGICGEIKMSVCVFFPSL